MSFWKWSLANVDGYITLFVEEEEEEEELEEEPEEEVQYAPLITARGYTGLR